MLRILAPHCDLIIFTEIAKNQNSASSSELVTYASQYTSAIAIPDTKKAVKEAKKRAKKNDLILVCGSIYMLGEAIKAVKIKK